MNDCPHTPSNPVGAQSAPQPRHTIMDYFFDDDVDETRCVSSTDDNFLLLPEHRERLEEVIRIQISLDPNRKIPAFRVQS